MILQRNKDRPSPYLLVNPLVSIYHGSHLAHAYTYTVPQEPTSGAVETLTDLRSPPPKAVSTTKDSLKVAGRFIQTLMTKLPEIADGNPAKMALSLAKVIIEIKKV
jgi:hypothetical protein